MEGHAGASSEVTAEDVDQSFDTGLEDLLAAGPLLPVAERGPSRLGSRWMAIICAVVMLLAAGAVTGGYFALRAHHESQAIARDNAEAIAAAKDCVGATQAPDVSALAAAQRKITECATGDFGAQAGLYGGLLAQIYHAADVHVQVSEMRAAVERDNDDGSVDLLVALRVKVDNVEAQGQEHGYRLRVKMAREDGQYRIANLDQVTK